MAKNGKILRNLARSRLLTSNDIDKMLDNESLFIGPLLERHVGRMGIDVRLDSYFLEITHTGKGVIDPFQKYDAYESTRLVEIDFFGGGYTLQPGKFVLGQTFEYIHFPPNVFAILDGRSSLGRLGIVIHSTAMSVDPGWSGHLTLELRNNGEMPVILPPLIRVARLILFETIGSKNSPGSHTATQAKLESKYYRQVKPKPSQIFNDPDLKTIKSINEMIKYKADRLQKNAFKEQPQVSG